jgi:hypothetical protein
MPLAAEILSATDGCRYRGCFAVIIPDNIAMAGEPGANFAKDGNSDGVGGRHFAYSIQKNKIQRRNPKLAQDGSLRQ